MIRKRGHELQPVARFSKGPHCDVHQKCLSYSSTRGTSEQLLRWKGIEAAEKRAASTNAKVVIIGAGKDGLLLILDTK